MNTFKRCRFGARTGVVEEFAEDDSAVYGLESRVTHAVTQHSDRVQ